MEKRIHIAMEMLWKGGFIRRLLLLVETDCLEAILMINGEEICMAAEGVIVDKIRGLKRLLQIPAILYAPRDANMVADAIAQFVARNDGCFRWFEIGSS